VSLFDSRSIELGMFHLRYDREHEASRQRRGRHMADLRPPCLSGQAALAGHPNINVYCYPRAGHLFFIPARPTYDAAAAALAAQRVNAALAKIA
jgi:dienelactone hydrolase